MTKKESKLSKYAKTLVAAAGTVVAFVIAVAGDDNVQFDGGEQGMVLTFLLATFGVWKARNKGTDLNDAGSEAKLGEVTQGGNTTGSGNFTAPVTPAPSEPIVVEHPYYAEGPVVEEVHAVEGPYPYEEEKKDRDC